MKNETKSTASTERTVPNTAIYRSKIKRMVEQAKMLTGLSRIPKGFPKSLKSNATEREREAFHKAKNSFLTIDTLHFLAEPSKRVFEEKKQPDNSPVEPPSDLEPIKI